MKILHLSTFDLDGGAARAAYRIHQGLQRVGVDSHMLVRKKSSDNRQVHQPQTVVDQAILRSRAALNSFPLQFYPQAGQTRFSSQWVPDGLVKPIQSIDPDLVNVHWVGDGYLQLETLPRLRKPIVWTLMDMYAFTGGCFYAQACERYQQHCGACPVLKSERELDLSRLVWQRKAKAWRNLNLTIVSPTTWLADCARSSALFRDTRIEVIPFCLETQVFKPMDQQVARQALNLPLDKRLVLFGAISAVRDLRKGFHLLLPALQQLSRAGWSDRLELAVFGSSAPEQPIDLGFRAHYLGHLRDDVALALLYSAADVMVVPSIQEAFGQTASEALACGTPVVAFAATGLKDIVDHQQTGYLAQPFAIDDLAQGIAWVLEDADRLERLRQATRQKAEREFRLELQGERYRSLYAEILGVG